MFNLEPFHVIGMIRTHLVVSGNGPAVVLVHGSQAWSYAWRFQIPELAQAGYQAIAVDMPGNGFSSAIAGFDYSIQGMSSFLSAVLDHFNLPTAVFMASSAGGLPVLDLAIRQPERVERLVLVSTCGIPHRLPLFWRLARVPLLGELMGCFLSERVVRQNLNDAVFDPSCMTDQDVKAYYIPLAKRAVWEANLKIERSQNASFVEKNLDRIQCPTLIIWGENDAWHPVAMARDFTRQIEGSQLVILPRCGHLPHEEQPDVFNSLMIKFLSDNDYKGKKLG